MPISTDLKYLEHEFWTYQNLYQNIGGWDVTSARGAIDQHDAGAFWTSSALSVVASRYPWIFGPLRQRKAPPLGLSHEATGLDQGKGRFAKEEFAEIMKANEASFGSTFGSLAMMGFSVLHHHLEPNPYDPTLLMVKSKPWPTSATLWHPYEKRFVAMTQDGLIPIVDDGHWSIIGEAEQPHMNGAIRALAMSWAANTYAERDEAALSAYLGRLCPIVILKDGVAVKDPMGVEAAQAVKDLAKPRSGALFPGGVDVKTLANVDAGAAALFAGFIERRSKGMAVVLLGTDGTVSSGTGGVYVSPLFGQIAFAIVREDTAHAARAWSRVGEIYGKVNYGLQSKDCPGYHWLLPDPTENDRLESLGKRYERAAAIIKAEREAGLDVTPERIKLIYEQLKLPVATAPATKAKAPIFAYHIANGNVCDDEVRETLGFEAIPGGSGSLEALAKRKADEATAREVAAKQGKLSAAADPAAAPAAAPAPG